MKGAGVCEHPTMVAALLLASPGLTQDTAV